MTPPKDGYLSREEQQRRNAALARDYKAGLPLAELHRRYGVHRSTCRAIIQRMGLPARNYATGPSEVSKTARFLDPPPGDNLCYSCGAWVSWVNDDSWCDRCAYNARGA